MGTVTVNQIIIRCLNVLGDTSGVRWASPELTDWVNDAQRQIAVTQPEASSKIANLTLVAGTKQTLPVGSIMLVRLNRNMGSSGTVPGEAPRRVSMAMMDMHRPTWNADTATLVVKNWMYDTRTPRVYYVYPPMSGATTLEAEYSVIPAVVASGTDTIALDDFYVNPIIDYVLWRAFSKDIEIPGMKSKAEAHRAAFDQSLDMTKAGEETNK